MSKLFQIYFFIFIFSSINLVYASQCKSLPTIKVGLINNNFIDYQYYLYYELGNYAINKELEFEIQIVKNNANEFDIIFGEYYDLVKLSQNKIEYPNEIKNFYTSNSIDILNNIAPLDLDTLVIISNELEEKIESFEEISNYFDPVKYTMGISFEPQIELAKFIGYNTKNENFDIKNLAYESAITSIKKIYKNLNKNILSSNYEEIYNSYENNENVFTLFSDGVLLNKNFKYQAYQLFPQSKYDWNEEKGLFINRQETLPFSYFGFSAYINNTNQFGFLCHLIKNKVRENSFRNFNIGLSPLSTNELESFDQLPKGYLDLINLKNENIINLDYENFLSNYELINKIIFEDKVYDSFFNTHQYLNEYIH